MRISTAEEMSFDLIIEADDLRRMIPMGYEFVGFDYSQADFEKNEISFRISIKRKEEQ